MAASPEPIRPFRVAQAKNDAATRAILERAARLARQRVRLLQFKPGVGAQVRAAQLLVTLNEINRVLDTLWKVDLTKSIQDGRKLAAQMAERAIEDMTRVAYAALDPDAVEALIDGFRDTAQAGINLDYARIPRELSALVYKNDALTQGHVEDTIRAGIVAGLNAKELAAEVYQYISPSTPGGASYAAMRLARTEMNNAFHEQQKLGANRPGVRAAKWNLSDSHPKPDECNIFAEKPSYLGVGCYAFGDIPDKPHPQCFCYLTYVTMKPAQFEKTLLSGGFDDELTRRTKANLARLGVDASPKPDAPPSSGKSSPGRKTTPKKPTEYATGDDAFTKTTKKRDDFDEGSDQFEAIDSYTGDGFGPINQFMRTGKWPSGASQANIAEYEKSIGLMRDIFKTTKTTSAIQVHRGFTRPEKMFGSAWNEDSVVGLKWTDAAFGSTSTDSNVAEEFLDENGSGGVMCLIRVPKGTPMLAIDDAEAEMLLGDGLTYTVVADLGVDDNGVRQLIVEVSR